MTNDLVRLLQEYVTEAERLGEIFAERHNMHPTDLHALLAVMQADQAGKPLTPGRLGEHLGLSSGATTAVIDRLERAGHVRRSRDDRDRRRVTLHHGSAEPDVGAAFFAALDELMGTALTAYEPSELEAVRRFLVNTNELMRGHRRTVSAS